MAFTSKKKNKHRKCWDREDDIYDYIKYKNTQNKNHNKFNYFNNLLNKFVIKHPKPDPELVQFTEGSTSILESHIFSLQEQNRDNNAEENLTEDEEEQNGFLADYFKPHGKSYVLDIVEDGVLLKYEDDEVRTRNRKGPVKRSAAKNGGKSKRGRKRKTVKGACFEKVGGGEKGGQVDTPSCMEVSVKEEIQDDDDDDDDDGDVEEIDMMHVDHDQMDNEAGTRKVAGFRERLMNELDRPYCEEECKRLLRDFNLRKPVQKQKILRGVEKTYEGDHDGKSYHDHNLDLAKQIDAAGDDLPKVLRLLRGFFFWLTNLTDEGAFLPWRVPFGLDLDVLPQH